MRRFFTFLLLTGCGSPTGPAPGTPGDGEAVAPKVDASSAPTEPDYRRGPQAAKAMTLGHLCEDQESVVFTCTLAGGEGMVSVCGVRAEEAGWQLTARYASKESPAVATAEGPTPDAPPALRYGRTEGATLTRTALAFAAGGTSYELQATYEHDTSCYQVLVIAPEQPEQTLSCTGAVFDQLGGLAGKGLSVEPYWR